MYVYTCMCTCVCVYSYAYNTISWTSSAYGPTIDGVVLTATPAAILARAVLDRDLLHRVSPVPVLLGSNKDEGTAFVSTCRACDDYLRMSTDYGTFLQWTSDVFSGVWADKVQKQYSMEKYLPFWAASKATGDFMVRCPARRAAVALSKIATGGADADPSLTPREVFFYDFTHSPISSKLDDSSEVYKRGGPCASGSQGAFHGAEVPFVFRSFQYLKTPQELAFSNKLARYWRNFAYSGDPNVYPPTAASDPLTQQLPHWPAFNLDSDQAMQLGAEPDGIVAPVVGLLKSECQLWQACEADPKCWQTDPHNSTSTSSRVEAKYGKGKGKEEGRGGAADGEKEEDADHFEM